MLIRERVRLRNALRGHLAEFGFVFPVGEAGVREAISYVNKADAALLPLAQKALQILACQYETMKKDIASLEKEILAWHKTSEASRRVATIPGIGALSASPYPAKRP